MELRNKKIRIICPLAWYAEMHGVLTGFFLFRMTNFPEVLNAAISFDIMVQGHWDVDKESSSLSRNLNTV